MSIIEYLTSQITNKILPTIQEPIPMLGGLGNLAPATENSSDVVYVSKSMTRKTPRINSFKLEELIEKSKNLDTLRLSNNLLETALDFYSGIIIIVDTCELYCVLQKLQTTSAVKSFSPDFRTFR